MSGGSRVLPGRPSLRYLRLEAKRRLAAGEFGTLHRAQAAIAREHGLPSWPALKRACCDGPALAQLKWVIARFSRAGEPGWVPPGEAELRGHFHDSFLAVLPPGQLVTEITRLAGDLRAELAVLSQTPREALVQLAGVRYRAAVDDAPPYRLTGLQGFPVGERVTDPRVAGPTSTTSGQVPAGIGAMAGAAFADLGLAALVIAGAEPGAEPSAGLAAGRAAEPWVVACGWADLDRGEHLHPGHRFPAPGVSALVTATAVLRLAAEGRFGLDTPVNRCLTTVRLADDGVTVGDLLSHSGGVDNPLTLFADEVPALPALTGPVVGCGGPRGVVRPSNGGYAVLGQLIADVTGMPYGPAVTRLVLDPLGMRDSAVPSRAPRAGTVTGYTVTEQGGFAPVPVRVCTIPAAGGLWTTANDLVRLGAGWSSLLPAALARQAVTPRAEAGSGRYLVGLGWLIRDDGETAVHAGAAPGFTAALMIRVRDGLTRAVVTSRLISVDGLLERTRP